MNNQGIRNLYSIIAPAKDEAGNILEFVERTIDGISLASIQAEIILIDDGSTDDTKEAIRKMIKRYPNIVRGYFHRKNEGLTKALKTGFFNTKGEYLIWISPDLEADPSEIIPLFVSKFKEGYDVVAGYRRNRGDKKNLASRIYNKVTNFLFKMNYKDKNWVKGFHRKCLPYIIFKADWHRFILAMLHWEGFKIQQVETGWSHRKYGKTKFGISRFPKSFIDAISFWFITVFSQKPMRFFGTCGTLLISFGIFLQVYLTIKYFVSKTQIRPLFWTSLFLETIGTFLIMFGFTTELIVKLEERIENRLSTKEEIINYWEEIL